MMGTALGPGIDEPRYDLDDVRTRAMMDALRAKLDEVKRDVKLAAELAESNRGIPVVSRIENTFDARPFADALKQTMQEMSAVTRKEDAAKVASILESAVEQIGRAMLKLPAPVINNPISVPASEVHVAAPDLTKIVNVMESNEAVVEQLVKCVSEMSKLIVKLTKAVDDMGKKSRTLTVTERDDGFVIKES